MEREDPRGAGHQALPGRAEPRLDFPHRWLRKPAPVLVRLRLRLAHDWLRRRAFDGTRGQPDDAARRLGKGGALLAKHPVARTEGGGDLGVEITGWRTPGR